MPNPACVEPVCDGLLIRVGAHERAHQKALRLARAVVKRNLRGKWRVEPLGRRSRDFEVTPMGKKTLPVGTAWNYVHKLAADRDVEDAEPSLETSGLEPDPDYASKQLTPRERVKARSARSAKSGGGDRHRPCSSACDWSIDNTRIDEAWKLPPRPGGKRFGKGIKVGHPDTGYTEHPEIWRNPPGTQRLRSGYDFVDDDPDAQDPLARGNPGHGTKTASVIMSDIGPVGGPFVSGAAPEASLEAYRVIKSVVVFRFKDVAKAILLAADRGSHVISMSLGGPFKNRALGRAVEYALERGVILLAAAGNIWPWVVYPAKLDDVIAVAASNCDDRPWSKSARGKSVDLSAPGESVWTAVTTGEPPGYLRERGHGTSFAVATVAGACALWLSHHGRRRLSDKYGKENLAAVFKEVVTTQGVRPPKKGKWNTEKYGAGILDAEKLLKAKLPDTPAAKGMRLRPKGAAAPHDTMTEIREYLPGYGGAAVRSALAKELRTKEAELDELLAVYGDEILFHLATNLGLRQSLQNRLEGRRPKSARANRQLRRQASRSLKGVLKI